MAANKVEIPGCNSCTTKKGSSLMYCFNCKFFLCEQCFMGHLKNPESKEHIYSSGEIMAYIDNKNNMACTTHKHYNISDINVETDSFLLSSIMSQSKLHKISLQKSYTQLPWNVRCMEYNFMDILHQLQPVKTIQQLPDSPFRLGVVNGQFWITSSFDQKNATVDVYNENLVRVKSHYFPGINAVCTAQQISDSDVILVACNGLYIADTKGTLKYQVMTGQFSDISIYGNKIALIEFEENKLVFLAYEDSRWLSTHEIYIPESDTGIKTLQLIDINTAIIAVHLSYRMIKVNIDSGEIMKQYGTGSSSPQLGHFDGSYVSGIDSQGSLIVCDACNDRFQILDQNGQWYETRLNGVQCPHDVVIMENRLYVFHNFGSTRKLSLFKIIVC